MKNPTSPTLKISKKYWTREEDEALKEAHKRHGPDWRAIATEIPGRNASQCIQRWKRIKPKNVFISSVGRLIKIKNGPPKKTMHQFNWKEIAKQMRHRSGRQIRERYINHLDPKINKSSFTEEEDERLFECVIKIGTRWSEMTHHFEGRTENMLKNRYYSYVRNKYENKPNPYYIVNTKTEEAVQPDEEVQRRPRKSRRRETLKDIVIQLEPEVKQEMVQIPQFPNITDSLMKDQMPGKSSIMDNASSFQFKWEDSLRMLSLIPEPNVLTSLPLKRSYELSRSMIFSGDFDNPNRYFKLPTPFMSQLDSSLNNNHPSSEMALSVYFNQEAQSLRMRSDWFRSDMLNDLLKQQ